MKHILKYTYIVLIALTVHTTAFAQMNASLTNSSFFGLNCSRYEPAKLGEESYSNVWVSLVNLDGWAGNTAFGLKQVTDLTNGEVDDYSPYINRLKLRNRLGAGALVEPLNFGFKINKNEEELFSLSFGIADRFATNFTYPGELFQLAYEGNAQFENQTIDMPMAFNAFWTREISIGGAMPVPIEIIEGLKLRAGLRLKYIYGLLGMYTERGNMSLYTAPEGRYLELDYDYLFHSTVNLNPEEDSDANEILDNIFNPKGSGFAFDFGVNATYKERFQFSLNFVDIGRINFSKGESYSYSNDGTVRYEGVELQGLLRNDVEIDTDIIDDLTETKEGTGSFKMPYPSRTRMRASYVIPAENKKGKTYNKHTVSAVYVQGFTDLGEATKRAYMSAAYTFNLSSVLEVGTNIGVRGYNRLENGLFIGLRAGFFRLGMGTNSIPLFRTANTGTDFNFNMMFAF